MKIYGIFNGEYSDWGVLGYYTTREEAEKRCAIDNEKGHDNEYVLELDCLDGTVETPKEDLHYLHEVVFNRCNGEWVMRDEPTRYEYSTKEYEEKAIRVSSCYGADWIAVYVMARQGETGRKKAEKIAQDRLYQYLALKNGLC